MAIPSHKADGSEGTATVEIDYENRKTTSRFYGCIVENDKNLKSFVRNHIKSSADKEMFSKTKYFFYTCDPKFEVTIITNSTTSCTVICHRFTKPNPKKGRKQSFSQNDFVKVQEHIFVPCDFGNDDETKKFNESNFLKKHCKKCLAGQTLNTKITYEFLRYVKKQQDKSTLKFLPLTVNGQSFKVSAEDYEKLVDDGGPVLLKEKRTVVGGFLKKENNEIFISIFEMTSTSVTDGGLPGGGTGQQKTHTETPNTGRPKTVAEARAMEKVKRRLHSEVGGKCPKDSHAECKKTILELKDKITDLESELENYRSGTIRTEENPIPDKPQCGKIPRQLGIALGWKEVSPGIWIDHLSRKSCLRSSQTKSQFARCLLDKFFPDHKGKRLQELDVDIIETIIDLALCSKLSCGKGKEDTRGSLKQSLRKKLNQLIFIEKRPAYYKDKQRERRSKRQKLDDVQQQDDNIDSDDKDDDDDDDDN